MAHVVPLYGLRSWSLRKRPRRASVPAFEATLDGRTVVLSGELRLTDAPEIWRRVGDLASGRADGIDLSRVRAIDGASMALLVALRADLADHGTTLSLSSPREDVQSLIHLYGGDGPPVRLAKRKAEGFVEHVGRAVLGVAHETVRGLSFFGAMVLSVGAVARRPSSAHWSDVPRIVERAGADAAPIVVLLNFLLGFVTGYEAIEQFRNYGANVYVADLVGLGVSRELAPLMTAIILAGRSGAGFAAELATMNVSDEIDALRTMGISPMPYLVWPRVWALALVAPILTLVGDAVGVVGGVVMADTSLDVSPRAFYHELATALRPWDVASGILKGACFAVAIALIACQQGLATHGGAEGVGRRTTATVVISLVAVVMIDTFVTVIYQRLSI